MDLELKGKTGLVLAGSQGLGRAIAESWAAEGVAVAVAARSREALDVVVGGIKARGGKAVGVVADLGDLASVEAAVAQAKAALGSVDMLLLNTGGPSPSTAAEAGVEVWESQFRALLPPLVRATELTLPDMRARGWGRIMYIAAPGIVAPMSFTVVSQAIRTAVASWLKALASAVAADGVTVNTIIPGMIETDRVYSLAKATAELKGVSTEAQLAGQLSGVPIGRLGQPREFAAVATFLASPLAAYVTGSILRADGGWITTL